MAKLPRQDRSIREKKYRSEGINKGTRTIDSAWVIENDEASDSSCVTFNIQSGAKSSKGRVIQNYNNLELGAYLLDRGGEYFKEYLLCAKSNGSETCLYAFKDGTYRKIPGTLNSFNGTNYMQFAPAESDIYFVDGEHVISYWNGILDEETGTTTSVASGEIVDLASTWTDDQWNGYWLTMSDGSQVQITDTIASTHKLTFTGAGVAGAYSIDEGIKALTAATGTVPVAAKIIRYWRNRLWAGNTSLNTRELIASYEFEYDKWDTEHGAFSILVDDVKEFPLLDVRPTFSTLGMLKGNSIYILVGNNETDWDIRQLPVDSGTLGYRCNTRGTESVYYLSDIGIKAMKGSQSLEASARYDVVTSVSISDPVDDKLADLSRAKKTSAHAVMFNDVLRVNFEDFVFRFNATANKGVGGIELDQSLELDIGTYIVDPIQNKLYGLTRTTGDVYELESGYSNYEYRPVDMINDETEWTETDCTISNNSTTGQFVYEQGVKMSITGAQTADIIKAGLTLNLSNFYDGQTDSLNFYTYISAIENLTSLTVRLITSSGNYYYHTIPAASLSVGLNNILIEKSDFSSTGTPDWATITEVQIVVVSTDDLDVTLNLMRYRSEGKYERFFSTKSFSFTPFDEYIKNFNEVRVWGRVNGNYVVNVDYYIDDSLTPSGTFTIDLSNQYFGYYATSEGGASTSAGINFITQTGKTWATNEWEGYYVSLRSGDSVYLITGNSADTLFIDGVGVQYDTSSDTVADGVWYGKDYIIVPAEQCFYTGSLDDDYTAYYGGGFDSVEFKNNPYLRGKRIKLKFYTSEANQFFEIFAYQFAYEVLQHRP